MQRNNIDGILPANSHSPIFLSLLFLPQKKDIELHIMRIKASSWFIIIRFQLQQAVMKLLYTDLKKSIAIILVYSGIILRTFGVKDLGLTFILKGRRVDYVNKADIVIRKILQRGRASKSEFSGLIENKIRRPLKDKEGGRFLILKLPVLKDSRVIEKGAIIMKFSETFIPMYRSLNINLLSKYFRIILEPSSSGYSAEEILAWTSINPEKLIVFAPEEGDYNFLAEMATNLVPVKLGAADWVNPDIFYKLKDIPKIYDAIYVANFNPVKRVDRFIRAIVRINRIRGDFRAALVCAAAGNTRREIMAMLKWANNKANISFFDGMPQSNLNKLLNQSKVNMLLSLKEGANKGLSEGLFSGTPAILLTENTGVKRANINDKTGKIVPDSNLEDTLIWFSEHYDEYQPHKWANKYLSPMASTQILEQKLEAIERADGRAWSIGLYPKVNQPELAYLHSDDFWLLPKRAELLIRFSNDAEENSIITFLEELQNTMTG